MKRYAVTALSALGVILLIAVGIAGGDLTLTDLQKDTVRILLILCGASILYCFTVGEIARNNSQMDKLWSLLPIAYTWITAAKCGFEARPAAFALIVTAWGIRLTVNFARKGAYKLKFWQGEEDYRWAILRSKAPFNNRLVWAVFDLFFISVYQNLLVLAICLPAVACMGSAAPLTLWDLLAAAGALSFLILETVADEYQWRFHREKKRLLAKEKELDRLPLPYGLGFNTRGPWAFMRHPNYLGEQGIWLCLYLFAVGAGVAHHGLFHWSATGPLLLVLLFMGSSALGESISAGKYPRYAGYAEQVFKYLPLRRYNGDK